MTIIVSYKPRNQICRRYRMLRPSGPTTVEGLRTSWKIRTLADGLTGVFDAVPETRPRMGKHSLITRRRRYSDVS
ncbi:hypothetical protein PISMIDRAFT_549036 [Pisolithus microcarpus 441]|uniref:Uncharacterized protein n=1 Tax=Pisolithus microcarpus 441 TaxID=765257 RepID=A0A0C9ZNF1_9AGAM|nr:hypothetical protein PISMIDRAFT_549036 [Pisolithus microcarpus 441]